MTFSIVACDREAAEWGVAVASKFPGVGGVVPYAAPGVGAVAVQALPGPHFGTRALQLLGNRHSPENVLDALLRHDRQRDVRQVGIVNAQGHSASYTGEACDDWAGGIIGTGYAIQGNILAGPDVVGAMHESFASGTGALAERLLEALTAGQSAGGDRRGQQGAALYVVRADAGYMGSSNVLVDLRVDDSPTPIDDLHRLLITHRLLFSRPKPEDFLPIDDMLLRELQRMLTHAGDLVPGPGGDMYDDTMRAALRYRFGCENLEERWSDEAMIDRGALEYLRERFATYTTGTGSA